MTEPLELLYDRLKEIDAIDCNDYNFVNYRQKYIATIRFLEMHGIGKQSRKKTTPLEEFYISKKFNESTSKSLMETFNINYSTLIGIIKGN